MIISRAPVRITLGGGGTDLASYYEKRGGFLIAAGISKHVYLAINRRFQSSIRLSYSQTEIVERADQIQHPIFKAAFRLLGIENGLECASIADVPANCGLGSSSTFTVALLNGLHALKREFVSLERLAEEACRIEIEMLGEPIGKQDQYLAAFGGLTALTFTPDGRVTVEPLRLSEERLTQLEKDLLLFYVGRERKASEILAVQNEKSRADDRAVLERLDRIKQIGLATRQALEAGRLGDLGDFLEEHWQMKRGLSDRVSDPELDELHDEGLANGARGGKLIGAGGGGFFLFYCPRDSSRLIAAMTRRGLKHVPFRFDFEGAKIAANL